jgi:hypothetical protein
MISRILEAVPRAVRVLEGDTKPIHLLGQKITITILELAQISGADPRLRCQAITGPAEEFACIADL